MSAAIPGERLVVSVVTPTLGRPEEVRGLLACLAEQTRLPDEVVLVDAADRDDDATELVVADLAPGLPFPVRHLRGPRGTAVQRNLGVELSEGDTVVLFDDDVRPEPSYLEAALAVLDADEPRAIGGVAGYRPNIHIPAERGGRWRWYRALRLLSTFQPNFYDWRCGYPINAGLQPPFHGVRPIEYMSTSNAVWRREVFDEGLQFDPFFAGYGVLEDAHFALRAGRRWKLVQCGDAVCIELHAAGGGRPDARLMGYKSVVNYWYVFTDVAGPLSFAQKARFWRFQAFELLRLSASAVRRRRSDDLQNLRGRFEGFRAVANGSYRTARA